jgi:hypothetical protein
MPKRFAVAILALLAAMSAGTAAPVAFSYDSSGAITFIMPSGNVACIYTPAGGSSVYVPDDGGPELACDRAEPTYLRFTLSASGPASVAGDVGDPSCCGGTNTFAYGSSWNLAPFSCTSATTGLVCKRSDGHGFTISKAKIEAH